MFGRETILERPADAPTCRPCPHRPDRRRSRRQAQDPERDRRRRAKGRLAGDPGRRSAACSSLQGGAEGGDAAGARPSRRSTSPISARWPAAAGGTALPFIGSRTIMSSNGAIMRARSRSRPGVVAKPPAEYHRARKGLTIMPLGSPGRLCAGARVSRAAGRSPTIPRPARPTSPIAMRGSASAATCRPTPARAASFMPPSAMRRATSTATSRSSAGWSRASRQ